MSGVSTKGPTPVAPGAPAMSPTKLNPLCERSKRDPHVPPGQRDGEPGHWASQHFPVSVPPTQDARQLLSGQSAKLVHAWPSFGPPAHRPFRRAMRRMVYGASEEPNKVNTSALGSAW